MSLRNRFYNEINISFLPSCVLTGEVCLFSYGNGRRKRIPALF